jgi:hypothetical protein
LRPSRCDTVIAVPCAAVASSESRSCALSRSSAQVGHDHTRRESCLRVTSCGVALATWMGTGRPAWSATAIIFVPLLCLVFRVQGPFFRHRDGAIDEALREIPPYCARAGRWLVPAGGARRRRRGSTTGTGDGICGRAGSAPGGLPTARRSVRSTGCPSRPLAHRARASHSHRDGAAVLGMLGCKIAHRAAVKSIVTPSAQEDEGIFAGGL